PVGVRGVPLAGRHAHDREREVLRRDHGRIAALAGVAGADAAVLGALVALALGILARRPVRLLLAEASDIFLHDVPDPAVDQIRRPWMSWNAHGRLLQDGNGREESMLRVRGASMKQALRKQRVTRAPRAPPPRYAPA